MEDLEQTTRSQSESHPVRDALRDLSREVGRRRLVLAIAPGGSGKTTLMRCWQELVSSNGVATAWLNVTPVHADVATMAEDLIDCLRVAMGEPTLGADMLRELSHVDLHDPLIITRRVGRALHGLSRPVVVFIDDFHLLETGGMSERTLDLLVRDERIPIHFVIASRGIRPRCSARLLMYGEALVVEAADLSLRSNQIASLLESERVEPESVLPLLLAETGGWAAGVRFAVSALSNLRPEDHVEFVRSLGRHDDLFEYIADEIIAEEEPAMVEMLERAALTGPLHESILNEVASDFGDAGRVDDALNKGLLVRSDERIGVHHLWEDLLKRRLRQRVSADDFRMLNRRLGDQLCEVDPRRTLVLWSEARFWKGVVEVLETHGRTWIYSGRVHFVAEWLARLPDGRVEENPGLTYLRSLTGQRQDAAATIASLEDVADRFRRLGDHRQSSAALMDAVIIAQNQNMLRAIGRIMPRLLSLRRLVTDRDARALGIWAVAMFACTRNRFALAVRILRQVRSVENSQLQRSSVIMILMLIGQYRDSAETLELLDGVIDDPSYRDHAPSHWMFIATRAMLRGFDGLDRERYVDEAREAAEAFADFGLTMAEMRSRDPLGRLFAWEGRREEALAEFARASALGHRIDDYGFEAVMLGRTALELLALGRSSEAETAACRVAATYRALAEHWRGREKFSSGNWALIARQH